MFLLTAALLWSLSGIVLKSPVIQAILWRIAASCYRAWSLVAFLRVFQMGLPYVLAARGVAVLSVQESALLVLLEPILVPLWAWLCWSEHLGWPALIGGGVILGGLAVGYAMWPDRVQPGS